MSRTIVAGLLGTALLAGVLWGMFNCRGESQERSSEIPPLQTFPQPVDSELGRQAEQLAEVVKQLAEMKRQLKTQRDELARQRTTTPRRED